jgi:hypothetical protein
MLTTFTNAKNFTESGVKAPAEVDKGKEAALTALGVLIPGEVVAAATGVSGLLSKKSDIGDGTAAWLHLDLARILMLVLAVIAIPLLFRVGAGGWWTNGWRGAALVLLTIVSFAGWLTLQPLSVYQGWLTVDSSAVAAVGIVAGLVIGGLAAILGWSQAIKAPPPGG